MATTTRGIDYSTLTLKDALDLAILVEEEAQERYEELTHQMETHRTPDAAAFFRYMAVNESKHAAALHKRRKALFGDAERIVKRTMIFDIEAPDYDEARAFMSPRQAMTTALRSEEKAHGFFVAALPRLTDPEVKALFEELCAEEVHHQELVKREIAKLGPDDVDGDTFVDEPVGH